MKKSFPVRFFGTASFLALAMCAGLSLGATTVRAQGADENVSVMGGPVPSAPDAPSANAQGGTPPQPVSIAPAEEATITAAPESESELAPPPEITAGTQAEVPVTTPVGVSPQTATPTADIPAATTTTAAPAAPAQDGLTPLPEQVDGSVQGTNVMGDSGVQQRHSGTYYDADALVPDSDLSSAGATGPRKVDPAYEPGQKYIVVKKGPGASSFEGQYTAATRALKLGRYAAAMEMFEKLYKKNHKDARVLMGLAVAQQGAGFSESAARTYEDLLEIQPNNADAIVNLMGIMRSQYPSVTLKKLTELRGKYPSNPGIPAQMGLVNAELKNYDDAIRYFEVAASMEPRNASHIFNMAIVADQKGDSSKAIRFYEQALQMDASYGDNANSLPREQIYDRLVVLRRKV